MSDGIQVSPTIRIIRMFCCVCSAVAWNQRSSNHSSPTSIRPLRCCARNRPHRRRRRSPITRNRLPTNRKTRPMTTPDSRTLSSHVSCRLSPRRSRSTPAWCRRTAMAAKFPVSVWTRPNRTTTTCSQSNSSKLTPPTNGHHRLTRCSSKPKTRWMMKLLRLLLPNKRHPPALRQLRRSHSNCRSCKTS